MKTFYFPVECPVIMAQSIQVKKQEYKSMKDEIGRLRETVEVLSNKQTIKKLERALLQVESGKYLTKKDVGL